MNGFIQKVWDENGVPVWDRNKKMKYTEQCFTERPIGLLCHLLNKETPLGSGQLYEKYLQYCKQHYHKALSLNIIEGFILQGIELNLIGIRRINAR